MSSIDQYNVEYSVRRFEANLATIRELEEENNDLRNFIERTPPLPVEQKVKDVLFFVELILKKHYRYIIDYVPPVTDAKIYLFVNSTLYHETYKWLLFLPSETTGGLHFKNMNLTNKAPYFSSTKIDKQLVEKLIDMKMLTRSIDLDD